MKEDRRTEARYLQDKATIETKNNRRFIEENANKEWAFTVLRILPENYRRWKKETIKAEKKK